MQLSSKTLLDRLPPLENNQRIVVAYSGGLDSHVLLHCLARLRDSLSESFQLEALHIHHGISQLADDWVMHCQSVCEQLNVPVGVRYVSADQQQASLENQLREARYQVFGEVLGAGDLLALAHHADDQAETLMLRMLRGTGPQGLAGMPAQRGLGEGMLIRPLLEFSRAELEAYAQQHELLWVEDDSNIDTRFDRNFLRHEVVPQLARRWPHYRSNFNRNAQVAKDAQQSLDYFLERELAPQMHKHCDGLACDWLLSYEPALQINLLRGWLNQRGLPLPGYKHLQKVLDEVVGVRVDAQPLVNWPGAEVRRFQNVVYANPPLPEHDASVLLNWNVGEPLSLVGAGRLTAVVETGAGLIVPAGSKVTVRFRQGGERCKLAGRAHSKLLKKQLNDLQLEPWLRDRLPLIYVDDELVALADVAICEGFQAADAQQGYILRWQRP
ncbi:MAG: tRNA lysidine(34) synthetase TilS [Pseudomonadales bacterium]